MSWLYKTLLRPTKSPFSSSKALFESTKTISYIIFIKQPVKMQFSLLTLLTICASVTALPGLADQTGAKPTDVHGSGWTGQHTEWVSGYSWWSGQRSWLTVLATALGVLQPPLRPPSPSWIPSLIRILSLVPIPSPLQTLSPLQTPLQLRLRSPLRPLPLARWQLPLPELGAPMAMGTGKLRHPCFQWGFTIANGSDKGRRFNSSMTVITAMV